MKVSLLVEGETGSGVLCIQIENDCVRGCHVLLSPTQDLQTDNSLLFVQIGEITNFPVLLLQRLSAFRRRNNSQTFPCLQLFCSSLVIPESFLLLSNLHSLSFFNKTLRSHNLLKTSTQCLFLPGLSSA